MTVVVPLSTLLSLISLIALGVLRASLCCAERLSFSFEKVMEAISISVRSKYLSSVNAGCGRRCQFDLTWNGWGLPAESANIYCKRI